MAHRPETEALSLGEKLVVIPNLAQAIFAALIRAFTSPFLGGAKANTYFKDVAFAALRKSFALTTLRQEALTTGTTETSYLNFAKEKKFQPDTDVLESGTKVHWLGSKSAEKTILYFHGGGFVLAAHPGQFRWFFDLQEEISKDRSVAVAVVSYTLAPGGQYPKQLQQCVESLSWLIKQGKKPSNVRSDVESSTCHCADFRTDYASWRLSWRQPRLCRTLTHPSSASEASSRPEDQSIGTFGDSPFDLALGQIPCHE